jgi:hypothetical protein
VDLAGRRRLLRSKDRVFRHELIGGDYFLLETLLGLSPEDR